MTADERDDAHEDAHSALALTRRLLRAVDADAPIAEALAAVCDLLGAARVNYYARDPVGRTLVMAHATAPMISSVPFIRVHSEEGASLAAQCLRTGRPIVRVPYQSSPEMAAAIRAAGHPEARSLTSLPVRVDGEVRGVVQAVNVAPDILTGDRVSLAEVVVLLGAVLESAERRQELATLGETILRVNHSLDLAATFDAVLDGMMALVPSLTAHIYLDGSVPDALVQVAQRDAGVPGTRFPVTQPRPIEGSLTGWVYTHCTSVLVPDLLSDPRALRSGPDAIPLDTDIRSYIVVPLLAGGETVGVLLCTRRGVGAFSERNLGVVERFAPLAAQAVINARLYDAAEQTRASSERILEDLADAIITLDLRGIVMGWNTGAERLLGYTAAEVIGKTPPVVPLDDTPRYAGYYRRVLAGESFVALEDRQRHKEGHWLDVLISMSPRRSRGRIVGSRGVIRDITYLKELEARLKAEIAAGERSARDQAYIAAVARACNSAADGPAILQALADLTAGWADAASVVTIEDGRAKTTANATRTPDEDAPLAPHIAAYTDLFLESAHSREEQASASAITHLRQAVTEYPAVQAALDCGYHTCAFAPIYADGVLVGTLNAAARDHTSPFDAQSLETMRLVAEQAGLAITKDRLLRQVEAQVRELEQASRHKDDFLASLSHELRTPLNAILGFGQMIAEGQLRDAAEVREAADDIVGSGQLLLGQVNDLLDMARVSAGQMTTVVEDVPLAPLVAACERVLLPLVTTKRQRLHADLPPDLPPVRADATRLRQVVLNLLTNAHKFTPEGGAISVRAWQEGNTVSICVMDNGIGIARENIALVFEPFRRVETGYARKQSGTGLGLALSRRLVEIMGGTLTVASTPDAGSTFVVSLHAVGGRQAASDRR